METTWPPSLVRCNSWNVLLLGDIDLERLFHGEMGNGQDTHLLQFNIIWRFFYPSSRGNYWMTRQGKICPWKSDMSMQAIGHLSVGELFHNELLDSNDDFREWWQNFNWDYVNLPFQPILSWMVWPGQRSWMKYSRRISKRTVHWPGNILVVPQDSSEFTLVGTILSAVSKNIIFMANVVWIPGTLV
jgi:hypothetical protein